jgi:hypothetical protein
MASPPAPASRGGDEPAEEPWATSSVVSALLDKIMEANGTTSDDAVSFRPVGGLTDGHVYELVDVVAARRKKSKFNVDVMLSRIMYVLLGGKELKLVEPPLKEDELTKKFGLCVREARRAFHATLATL